MEDRMRSQEIAKAYSYMVGKKYRHFKGTVYVVSGLAIHSETSEVMVIYKNLDNPLLIWCRPFKMFVSPVDREKYPDVKQRMRFEPVED